jgi:hypothetical protein
MWVIKLLELANRQNPIAPGVEHRFGYELVAIDCIFRSILEDDFLFALVWTRGKVMVDC